MHAMGIRLAALLIVRWTNLDPAVIIKRCALLFLLAVAANVTGEKQVVLNGCLLLRSLLGGEVAARGVRGGGCKEIFNVLSLYLTFPIKTRDGSINSDRLCIP